MLEIALDNDFLTDVELFYNLKIMGNINSII